jgi:hypothetical protein
MTTMISEVYDAFREAGVSDEKAKAAAAAVIGLQHAATKTDVAELRQATRADIAELKAELIRTMWLQAGVIIGALSLVFGGIATLIKVL